MAPSIPTQSAANTPETLTVSQLNRMAKRLLESHFDYVWIEGELSNIATPASGHWYFTLKDDAAQVRCAMFRNANQRVRLRPQNGQLVRIRARVSLYEGRGEFQLIVEFLEDAGAGALQRAFEALKLKLQNEGLFAPERKRDLPDFPERVAIVSSRSGAAVRDVITVLQRRFPAIELSLFPVPVQGEDAAPAMVAALESIYREDRFDAIILTRGGGSAEDLWAFNDESLARRIADSPIPLVSAVGHEIDFTIADFVADRRAPTPSAAAEMLSPDQREITGLLLGAEQTLSRQYRRHLRYLVSQVTALKARLRHPGDRLREQSQRLDDLDMRLRRAQTARFRHYQHDLSVFTHRMQGQSPASRVAQIKLGLSNLSGRAARSMAQHLQRANNGLALQSTRLTSLSPERTLERGYAIVMDESGKLVQSAAQVNPGDRITTRLGQGSLTSDVVEVREEPEG